MSFVFCFALEFCEFFVSFFDFCDCASATRKRVRFCLNRSVHPWERISNTERNPWETFRIREIDAVHLIVHFRRFTMYGDVKYPTPVLSRFKTCPASFFPPKGRELQEDLLYPHSFSLALFVSQLDHFSALLSRDISGYMEHCFISKSSRRVKKKTLTHNLVQKKALGRINLYRENLNNFDNKTYV